MWLKAWNDMMLGRMINIATWINHAIINDSPFHLRGIAMH